MRISAPNPKRRIVTDSVCPREQVCVPHCRGIVTIGRRPLLREQEIREKYGQSVFAIFFYGLTAKNLDRPYSDIEVLAVLSDDQTKETKYYVYGGSVVEISYVTESEMLKGASELSRNWPMEAD